MFRKTLYYALILVFATSCVVAPSATELDTPKAEFTSVAVSPTGVKQSIIVVSPTGLEQSIVEIVEPKIEKICPANAEVPINEIGLPNNLSLLAVDENEILGGNLGTPLNSSILKFSGINPRPENVEKIRLLDNDAKIINILLSPSGLWLAIFRWNATKTQETLWISTPSGEEKQRIADISPKQKVFWISDNEIVVVGVPNEADYEGPVPEEEMRPLLSINTLSSETHNLEPLPEGAIYVHGSYHSKDGYRYSMYYRDDNQKRNYFLYDYTNKTSTQIFRWIDSPVNSTSIGVRPNGLYFVERSIGTGIDFALDLSVEQITEDKIYNDVMNHLTIDSSLGFEITSMLSSLTKAEVLILTSDPIDYEKPTPMYFFDYKADIIKDYCINLGLTSTVFSPDDHFVAFTINEGINTSGYHVLLLNLKTGYYSVINDIKAIGFGITN